MCCQKSLGLIGLFKPLHLSLLSSRGSVRILGAIFQIPARSMTHMRQDGSMSDAIAAQAVGDEAARLISQPMQEALEQTLGGCAVPPILHQNVEYDPVLVHRAPQNSAARRGRGRTPRQDARYRRGCGRLRGSLLAKSATELQAPMPDALIGHHDAAFGQDQLDVAQAETEHVIQPDSMADDFGRKPMARIRGGLVGLAVSFAHLPL
jgi:hypothetical protein